jgi:hypothetical protein
VFSTNERLPNFEAHLAMVELPQSQFRIVWKLSENPARHLEAVRRSRLRLRSLAADAIMDLHVV